MRAIEALFRDRRGATVVEYGLICAFIVLAILGGLNLFASAAVNKLNNVANAVANATG